MVCVSHTGLRESRANCDGSEKEFEEWKKARTRTLERERLRERIKAGTFHIENSGTVNNRSALVKRKKGAEESYIKDIAGKLEELKKYAESKGVKIGITWKG